MKTTATAAAATTRSSSSGSGGGAGHSMALNSRIVILFILLSGVVILFTAAELYTSMEEMSYWATSRNRIVELIDEKLDSYGARLQRLQTLRQILARILELDENRAAQNGTQMASGKVAVKFSESQLMNPIGAFIALNRLANDLDEARALLEEDETPYGVASDFDKLIEEANLPTEDDVVGGAEALIRLQIFYNLNSRDLANGRIITDKRLIASDTENLRMNSDDCFRLGRVAVKEEQHELALEWLELAMSRANRVDDIVDSWSDPRQETNYVHLLEYMAYTAYKCNRIKYALELSKLWLGRRPDSKKARDNVDYFTRHLASEEKSATKIGAGRSELGDADAGRNESGGEGFFRVPAGSSGGATDVLADPQVEIARRLCRETQPQHVVVAQSNQKCHKITRHWPQIPELKLEILSESPRVMRVHDMLTDKEAQRLRQAALPSLTRSTIGDGAKVVTTKNRIAKTAWLERPHDLSSRVAIILGIDLSSSEELQVVNYGLGGFYDLHIDAFPNQTTSLQDDDDDEDKETNRRILDSRINNNRLATVLMYLNEVEAGGSTVFPGINVTAQPIKGSAIIWFNLHRNRTIDRRTRHMGCPVLLGSKWIATIWPREAGNMFHFKCGLNKDDD